MVECSLVAVFCSELLLDVDLLDAVLSAEVVFRCPPSLV